MSDGELFRVSFENYIVYWEKTCAMYPEDPSSLNGYNRSVQVLAMYNEKLPLMGAQRAYLYATAYNLYLFDLQNGDTKRAQFAKAQMDKLIVGDQ